MVPLTVACVYKPGGGFTDDYVYRMQKSLQQHLHTEHEFVCLTNVPLRGVKTIPLIDGYLTWWNKLQLFRKGLFPGRVVYLDLDTMIVGDVTDIFTHPAPFIALSDFLRPQYMASAYMAWNGDEDYSRLFTRFAPHMEVRYMTHDKWGDQGFIAEHLGVPYVAIQSLFPGRIVHYKSHIRGWKKELSGIVPKGASIVCFSGKPRPHEINWTLKWQ